jgi:hypothetical protein
VAHGLLVLVRRPDPWRARRRPGTWPPQSRRRGSSASRMPSPSRLNPRTASEIVSPGAGTSCGARSRPGHLETKSTGSEASRGRAGEHGLDDDRPAQRSRGSLTLERRGTGAMPAPRHHHAVIPCEQWLEDGRKHVQHQLAGAHGLVEEARAWKRCWSGGQRRRVMTCVPDPSGSRRQRISPLRSPRTLTMASRGRSSTVVSRPKYL